MSTKKALLRAKREGGGERKNATDVGLTFVAYFPSDGGLSRALCDYLFKAFSFFVNWLFL